MTHDRMHPFELLRTAGIVLKVGDEADEANVSKAATLNMQRMSSWSTIQGLTIHDKPPS